MPLVGKLSQLWSSVTVQLMALLNLLPGIGVIFLVLGIYRLASKGKEKAEAGE